MRNGLLGALLLLAACEDSATNNCHGTSITLMATPAQLESAVDGGALGPDGGVDPAACMAFCANNAVTSNDCFAIGNDGGFTVECRYICGE